MPNKLLTVRPQRAESPSVTRTQTPVVVTASLSTPSTAGLPACGSLICPTPRAPVRALPGDLRAQTLAARTSERPRSSSAGRSARRPFGLIVCRLPRVTNRRTGAINQARLVDGWSASQSADAGPPGAAPFRGRLVIKTRTRRRESPPPLGSFPALVFSHHRSRRARPLSCLRSGGCLGARSPLAGAQDGPRRGHRDGADADPAGDRIDLRSFYANAFWG